MAARAIQRWVRQSPRKMRLVVGPDPRQERERSVRAAAVFQEAGCKQIEKVLRSAVSNAEQDALRENAAFDVDQLFVSHATVNEGPTLWRHRAGAMGRAAPIRKRMSHVEIHVAAREESE